MSSQTPNNAAVTAPTSSDTPKERLRQPVQVGVWHPPEVSSVHIQVVNYSRYPPSPEGGYLPYSSSYQDEPQEDSHGRR
jgi:hypothetical protein